MLKGKTAIVTGAARGIGKATTDLFVRNGAIVYGVDNREELLDGTCTAINKKYAGSGSALAFPGDVTDASRIKELFQTVKKKSEHLDILVNCAGLALSALMNMTPKSDIERNFDVNAIAIIELTKLAARLMERNEIKEGNRGKIINVSSIAGTNGNRGQIAYSGSKAAVIGITKSAAKELAPKLITCNAVAPGVIQTPMLEEALAPKIVQDYVEHSVLMKRLGTAEDIANAIFFFAGNTSNYITGQVINVDGGFIL